jgi:hypothetical protein
MAATFRLDRVWAVPRVVAPFVPADPSVVVAHDIPGRIRFGIPSLKGNGAATLVEDGEGVRGKVPMLCAGKPE